MPIVDWQNVVAVLKGALYFREHYSDLNGAYLWKAKTAESELGSNAPEVRFDTFRAQTQYFYVTLVHDFVTVRAVAR